MKKIIINRQLTDNFSLYEFIEAPADIAPFNWRHINEFDEAGYELMANHLQGIRNEINAQFPGQSIGLRITSGFRCLEWERLRKRSGQSQHTIGVAVDIQPTNCTNERAVEVLRWLYDRDNPKGTGHFGGFAIKRPVVDAHGRVLAVGFIHYDLRPTVARWEYL